MDLTPTSPDSGGDTMGRARSFRSIRRACYLVLLCGLVSSAVCIAADTTSVSNGYEKSIETLEATITLLKWVGCAVVAGLVSGIGLLYRALEQANATIRTDLSQALEKRASLMEASLLAQTQLAGRIEILATKMESVSGMMGRGCPYGVVKEVQ